ncbi:alginate lyase family protein [Gilvimarinus agarilyticus]|uniref:alginate lyase family protein n=1 Tax=Gilvimarinus agarilyticus TaxID=679259 RepID=UPI001E3049AB|nr:alginate lyase family protein [Gilvimarinus agarilyticus]
MSKLFLFALLSGAYSDNSWAGDSGPMPPQKIDDSCPKPIVEPYAGPLQIESKYVQSDNNKATLKASLSDNSKAVKTQIEKFSKQLVVFSDYYVRESAAKAGLALDCVHAALGSWAEAGALLSKDASKTGVAVRKWTLASISMVTYKLKALSGGEFQLTEAENDWLIALADRVSDDYRARLDPNFKYFNNHDYWAAWALLSTSMATESNRHVDYSYAVLARALRQVEFSADGKYGWLPNEIGRSQLALNYMHYALNPLVMLAYYADDTEHLLTPKDEETLAAMVRFVSAAELSAKKVSDTFTAKQDPVPAYKLAWLIPYLHQHPSDEAARALFNARDGKVDGYSQLGGLIAPLFSVLVSATGQPKIVAVKQGVAQ